MRLPQALLSAPNPDDPLDETVAAHWKSDEASAIAKGASVAPLSAAVAVLGSAQQTDRYRCACLAKQWTAQHAQG